MPRFNTKELEILIPYLIARDGRICQNCEKPLDDLKKKVNVHHRNGDQDDRRKENLELQCHRCNILESRKRRILQVEKEINAPIELRLNSFMEAKFVSWLYGYLLTHPYISWQEARDSGAAEADCNPETTRKYLFKHTAELSDKVLFRVDERGHVVFKTWVKEEVEKNQNLV